MGKHQILLIIFRDLNQLIGIDTAILQKTKPPVFQSRLYHIPAVEAANKGIGDYNMTMCPLLAENSQNYYRTENSTDSPKYLDKPTSSLKVITKDTSRVFSYASHRDMEGYLIFMYYTISVMDVTVWQHYKTAT